MNERIRELMKQANPSGDFSDCEWVFEKFAELIVRECADIADIDAHQHESPGLYVRQHFGIEGE